MREVQDHFFRQAKVDGYRSRAAYKLVEIDDRKRILRRGDWVLDAGCAPGSWMQVAAARVGPQGRVVGLDLKECDPRGLPPSVRVVRGDLTSASLEELLGPWMAGRGAGVAGAASTTRRPPFDVLLSDIGPDTTGDPSGDSVRSIRLCHVLLDRAVDWLRPGGNLVMKVYEGGDYPELLRRTRALFEDAKGYKPEASRSESVEIYLIGKGWKPVAATSAADQPSRPRRRGWGE